MIEIRKTPRKSESENMYSLTLQDTLRDAVRVIEDSRKTMAVVVDDSGHLLGTITDGDIRRAFLSGYELDATVDLAMNYSPITSNVNMSSTYLLDLLTVHDLEAIPLVDAENHFVRVIHVKDLVSKGVSGGAEGFNAAVIMAGGEGRRLRPITDNLPKPMVEVGGMPLIEGQVRRIARSGIKKIFISINYLGSIIEEHLGNGVDFGVDIEYLREDEKLGTAGALSLISEKPTGPLMVINGDVLTMADHKHFLNYHIEHEALITIGAISYRVDIPFGVIHKLDDRAVVLEEKPTQRFLCNAGIYAISPETLDHIPKNTSFDMTDLIKTCMDNGKKVAIFPLHEYWSDIGTPAELEKAQKKMHDLEKDVTQKE